MNRKITIAGIIVFILVGSIVCIAQTRSSARDVLYLKNGSVIKGVIVELIPEKTVKIETADGSVLVFNMSEVLKIAKEEIQQPKPEMEQLQSDPDKAKDKKNGIIFNPVGLILSLAAGGIDFEVEYQRSLSRYLSFYLNPDFGSISYLSAIQLGVGIYVMPLGKSLNGLYFKAGIIPGIVTGYGVPYFGVSAQLGWQFVTKSNFMLQLGIGYDYVSMLGYGAGSLSLSLAKMGFAF
jgi:hypothetical protein